MSAIDDGGPAFPVSTNENKAGHFGDAYGHQDSAATWQFPGMTLRDYFAAKAMQALIAKGMDNTQNRNKAGVPVIAGFAYEYADAMLKAREP